MADQQINSLRANHFQLVTLGRIALRCGAVEDAELGKRRRKLALLAVLALSRRPPTRDALTEMFWGDETDERARHSLSDTLSHLRRVLGRDAIATRSEVVELALDGRIAIDAVAFESACECRDFARAIELYGGPFLPELYVEASPSFEQWLSRYRNRYARLFELACEERCAELTRAGTFSDLTAAKRVAERWLEASPESTARRVLEGVDAARSALAAGESVGRAAAARQDRGRQQVASAAAAGEQGPPSAVVDPRENGNRNGNYAATRSANQNATQNATQTGNHTGNQTADEATSRPAGGPTAPAPARTARFFLSRAGKRRLQPLLAASLVVAALCGAGFVLALTHRPTPTEPVVPLIAITDVRTDAADSSLAWLGEGLKQMIAADLARVPSADVVAPALVRQTAERAGWKDSLDAGQNTDLARRVHASLAVSAKIGRADGSYIVDVTARPVDAGGSVAQYTVTGRDILSVADQIAASLLANANAIGSGPRLSEVETGSTEAYRHYVNGERLLSEAQIGPGLRELDAAIAADSGFTSAIVARLRSGGPEEYARIKPLFDRARLRMTEWDRMDEAVYEALHRGEHVRAEVLARALTARFPRDPRAFAALANVYVSHGKFAAAESTFHRLLALDSLALLAGNGACAACSAFLGLAGTYHLQRDFAGHIAAVRRWTQIQPGAPGAWTELGNALALSGQYDDAVQAFRRGHELSGETGFNPLEARVLIMARRYDAADSLVHHSHGADAITVRDIDLTILRERGQWNAALASYAAGHTRGKFDGLELIDAHLRGQMGHEAEARAILEGLTIHATAGFTERPAVGSFAGDDARAFAWHHSLEADAIWQYADTTYLHALADSVERIGAQSYYARDWEIHHHIRGLIAERAGRLDDAERELTAGIALLHGWTRTNVELARVQLRRGEPQRAIATLRDAYHEPVDAMGRYVPRSELDFQLSLAFAAAGRTDSANVYAGYARRAWAHADPSMRRRLDSLTAVVAMTSGTRSAPGFRR